MPAVSIKSKRNIVKKIISSVVRICLIPSWSLMPRVSYLGEYPVYLGLALTRKCNANCVFCAYQVAKNEDKVHMSDTMFELVVAQIKETKIKYVMISPNIGEPLLAPKFIDKIKKLRESGVKIIEVTTNALLLHEIGLKKILIDGPDIINISFAGFDKAMYERDYRVKNYERTRDNILDLLRLNKTLVKPIAINLRLRGDLPREVLLSAQEVQEVMLLASDVEVMTEVDSWLGMITKEMLPSGYVLQCNRPKLSRRPCKQLFDLTVHPNGDIQLCSCRNIFGEPDLYIGNIRELSLRNAHKKIPKILSKWESGHVPVTCETCSMYIDPASGFLGRWRQICRSYGSRKGDN